jgi:hypothetical protein
VAVVWAGQVTETTLDLVLVAHTLETVVVMAVEVEILEPLIRQIISPEAVAVLVVTLVMAVEAQIHQAHTHLAMQAVAEAEAEPLLDTAQLADTVVVA